MPNWCFTSVIFTGRKENITQLNKAYEKFNGLLDFSELPEGEAGSENWFGYFLMCLGGILNGKKLEGNKIIKTTEDNTAPTGRSFIEYFECYEDEFFNSCESNERCLIELEDAWNPHTEMLDWIAEEFDLEYDYMAEEPGSEIFINTNPGLFDTVLRITHGDDESYYHVETWEEYLSILKCHGLQVDEYMNEDEVDNAIRKRNRALDYDDEEWISVMIYKDANGNPIIQPPTHICKADEELPPLDLTLLI